MKRSNSFIKNSKWKSFLFFLFLASLFWLLTKISKEFIAPVSATIVFMNVPETVSIKETNADEITFNLFTNGYEFLGYKLKQPSINVDVSKFENENNTIRISNDELLKEINEQFPSTRAVNTLNLDVLTLKVDPIVRKKVPVKVNNKVTYKNGFRLIGAIAVSPDSVFVSGPQKNVAEIDSVNTETVLLDLLEDNISEKVNIIVPQMAGISVSNKTITASWVVKEIAQKEFEIPVQVINKPSGVIIKIIPNRVKIKVDVTLDHFNDITANDFEIFCDYDERNTDENFMIAHLRKKTEWVEHIELATQKIDFLIFKE